MMRNSAVLGFRSPGWKRVAHVQLDCLLSFKHLPHPYRIEYAKLIIFYLDLLPRWTWLLGMPCKRRWMLELRWTLFFQRATLSSNCKAALPRRWTIDH